MGISRFFLTPLEITFNRLFAVLLILSAPLLLFNPSTVPTVVIFAGFALFLLFAKRYHPVVNFLFLILALGVYFIPIPIGWGLHLGLREFKFGGYVLHQMILFFYLSPFIFITLSARNVLGNILSYFNPSSRWRNIFYFLSLMTVMTAILAFPLLSNIELRQRAMENTTGSSALSLAITMQELKLEPGENASSSALARRYYTARFDPVSNVYIYRLYLEDPLSQSIVFSSVETDGEKINFATDRRIDCANCQKDESDFYRLVFPAGSTVDFIITSDQFIKTIEFTESNQSVASYSFWK